MLYQEGKHICLQEHFHRAFKLFFHINCIKFQFITTIYNILFFVLVIISVSYDNTVIIKAIVET